MYGEKKNEYRGDTEGRNIFYGGKYNECRGGNVHFKFFNRSFIFIHRDRRQCVGFKYAKIMITSHTIPSNSIRRRTGSKKEGWLHPTEPLLH